MSGASAPTSRSVEANGLRHHVLEWRAEERSSDRPILLCHGYLDVAWTFDGVARALAARGRDVLAFDWRGHGESEWIGRGGYYHFVDYILDLRELTRTLGLDQRGFELVGHSMGGTACAMFAATRPAGLGRLALLEGLGPEDASGEPLGARIETWLESVARLRERAPRPLADLDDAIRRLRATHPRLDPARARFIAEKHTATRDGALYFAFDPLHRTRSPMPFRADAFTEQLGRITAPTLVVNAEHGFRPEGRDARAAAIPTREVVELPGVGHMVHWEAEAALADLLARFFRDEPAPSPRRA